MADGEFDVSDSAFQDKFVELTIPRSSGPISLYFWSSGKKVNSASEL